MPRVTRRPVAEEENTTMTEQERIEVVERARLALANAKGVPNPNWDESKHPRGADGRFGHGVPSSVEKKETTDESTGTKQQTDPFADMNDAKLEEFDRKWDEARKAYLDAKNKIRAQEKEIVSKYCEKNGLKYHGETIEASIAGLNFGVFDGDKYYSCDLNYANPKLAERFPAYAKDRGRFKGEVYASKSAPTQKITKMLTDKKGLSALMKELDALDWAGLQKLSDASDKACHDASEASEHMPIRYVVDDV